MTLDALAFETQFLVHLAPVWRAIPEFLRGRFLVDRSLMEQAQRAGIEAEPIDAQAVRESMPLQPPKLDGKPALVASIGDIKVGRRLGYGPFAFLEHGAGQTYDSSSGVMSSYAGGPDRADNELFMVPNEYAASRWRLAYPNARVEVVGSPRLADLPSRVHSIGIQWDTWEAFSAVIRKHLRTSASDPAGRAVCVAHAIADASQIGPENARSQAVAPSLNTTASGTSPDDLTQPSNLIALEQSLTEPVRSAMSECTSSSGNSCQASATSADLPTDWKLPSAGIHLMTGGGSPREPGSPTLRIPTTTFGSVSLAMSNTTVRDTSLVTLVTAAERRSQANPVVAISWHWDGPRGVPYGGTALGDFLPMLPKLAERFNVIGHAHPKGDWPIRMERLYTRAGIPFVRDFEDVCRQADVYVCDNSSTIWEFASTGRPVVLMNAAVWHRKGGPGLRFWDAAHVGINVWPQDDLPVAIEQALANRPQDVFAREHALNVVYAHRDDAAHRAAIAVVDWMASKVGVAA